MKPLPLTVRSRFDVAAVRCRRSKSWMFAVVFAIALACVGAPRASAQGSITGQILDVAGKPWVDINVDATSDQGLKLQTKTDKEGNFMFRNLRAAIYVVVIELPAPSKPYEAAKVQVGASDVPKIVVNFKDIVSKQGSEYAEAQKKQDEEKSKFQGMKQHFEAGIALLAQANTAKSGMAKTPADQRDTVKAQVADLSGKAVTELEAAKAAAPEKDANLNLIWARLGDAYELAGRIDDAVNAYQQAIVLKPTAAYYNNLGGILGRAGKTQEALAAYQKCAELDPPNAAGAWRNAGITLYNVGKMKEAVEPLKKSTDLDPKSAQTWYLLGAALVGSMDYKQVGDKLEVNVQPGTLEAYQKAVELDPNGIWGAQAKQGIDALAQMDQGIATKLKTKKKS